MARVRRYDRLEFRGDWASRTPEGYLRGEAIVTRTGVFTYVNADGTPRYVLRHPDDVFAASHLHSMQMIPVTNLHPPVGLLDAGSVAEFGIGYTGQNVQVDGKFIVLPFAITVQSGVDAVEKGQRELSMGYTCQENAEAGEWQGQHYDYRQTEIIANHLAVVPRGRAGAEARINLDGDEELEVANYQNRQVITDQGERQMLKINIDGIQYDAAPEVAKALEKALATVAEQKSRLDAFKRISLEGGGEAWCDVAGAAALEKLRGERDALKSKLDAAEKALKPESLGKMVKERLRLLDTARRILDDETLKPLEDGAATEIQKAVILAKAPEQRRAELKAQLDQATPEYLQARFDAIVEGLPEAGQINIAQQRVVAANRDHDPVQDEVEKERKAYHDRLENGWKSK